MIRVSVDGVPLDDAGKRWFLDYASLLPASAARTVSKLSLPGRAGPIVRRQGWGEGSLRLVLDVPGAGAFGTLPVNPVEERVATLQALLSRAESVSVSVDGGVARSVEVTDVSMSDPARLGVNMWRVEVVLTLQPFWREESTLTYTALDIGAVVFSQWAGSTGDVMDGVLRLKGPFTKAVVSHGGREARFGTVRSASQYLFFEPSSFTAWTGDASAWERPASMSDRVVVEYGASGPLTTLTPSTRGVEVAVSGEGMVTVGAPADRTQISLRGGRYWL